MQWCNFDVQGVKQQKLLMKSYYATMTCVFGADVCFVYHLKQLNYAYEKTVVMSKLNAYTKNTSQLLLKKRNLASLKVQLFTKIGIFILQSTCCVCNDQTLQTTSAHQVVGKLLLWRTRVKHSCHQNNHPQMSLLSAISFNHTLFKVTV